MLHHFTQKLLQFIQYYKQELFIIVLSLTTIAVAIPIFTYLYFAKDLTSKDALMNRNDTGVILTDRNNKPFFTFYQTKLKRFVPLSQIPLTTQEALIASEDKDFYYHPGFSVPAIIRSLTADILHRDVAYGGSTITQQLVKNSLLTSNKSFLRKYQEIVLAQEVERRFSKKEILEMYLNSVYFGEGAFGIENGAETYFGKHASQLTVPEAALLVGLLPSPSTLSPLSGNATAAKEREKVVLEKMEEQGYISQAEEKKDLATALQFHTNTQQLNEIAPHFALMIRDQLVKKYGEEAISRSGFRVRTTLDLSKQQYAEQVVAQQVARLAGDNVSNGAAVIEDPKTGEILALVGSKNWYDPKDGKVNMATTPRSVGSSFKPIIYSLAMEEHLITPATVLRDEPTTFQGDYRPLDYDRKFRGPVLVRRALANSLNVPAVEVMDKVGVKAGLEKAAEMGITTLGTDASQYGDSLVLGAGEVPLTEMTNVYAAFATGGQQAPITTILSITDKTGKPVYTYHPETHQVVDPGVAFLISSILSDNQARAEEFGNALTISRPAAVKTGTAEDYKDALTLGYTPSLVVGVWVGNNDNEPMDQIAGSLGAAPIWRQLMEYSLADTPVETFTKPEDIIAAPICASNGLLLRNTAATSSARMEYFLPGTAPTQYCYIAPTTPPIADQEPQHFSLPPGIMKHLQEVKSAQDMQQQMQQQLQQMKDQMKEQEKQH